MSEYRIRTTGTVVREDELRRWSAENNGPSWGQTTSEVLEVLGVDPVFEGAQATLITQYQYSMRQGVEQIDGKWYTKYVAGPIFVDRPATPTEPAKTAAEQEAEYKAAKDAAQAKSVREQRNTKLKDCDWTQLADTPGQVKAAYVQYRQALRDVPAQAGFPWTVNWPVAP